MSQLVGKVSKLGTAAFTATVLVAGVVLPLGPAEAVQRGPVVSGYLALGDSVAFGYVPSNAASGPPNYNKPSTLVGYPEDLAKALDTKVANASCPGETTMSFLAVGAQSNGCENSVSPPYSPDGYRTFWPLHVRYSGSQMAYAISYLQKNPSTQLVTIDIGANDAFICQETTSDNCLSGAEIGALFTQIKDNLSSIYQQIREIAGYKGTIVALSYYSTDYSNKLLDAETLALNSIISKVTRSYGGVTANGYQTFKGPSDRHGGSPCNAGLLIKIKGGGCNIHPSAAGHLLLAAAIARVIGA